MELDVANLILKQLNLWRMLAKLLECQVLQMTSYGPQDAPGHSGYPTIHWKSTLCFVEHHSQQVLPAYKDPEKMRTDPTQLPAQGEDEDLGATAQGKHMLRHIKLQFHQRK